MNFTSDEYMQEISSAVDGFLNNDRLKTASCWIAFRVSRCLRGFSKLSPDILKSSYLSDLKIQFPESSNSSID